MNLTHEAMFGKAQWIGGDGKTTSPYIRARFHAPDAPRGRITVCGLGVMELYINGQRVGEHLNVPAVSDYAPRVLMDEDMIFDEEMGHRCYCLQYDITPYLKSGENQLAAALGQGYFSNWDHGFIDGRYGEVRLCYRMELTGADGTKTEVLSGPDARWAQGHVTRDWFYAGEIHDLRLHPQDWTTAPFEHFEQVRILDAMDTEYLLQTCPGDRVTEVIAPRVLKRTDTETVYDATKNLTGHVVLKCLGNAGDIARVRFSELLDENGMPHEDYGYGQFFEVIMDGTEQIVHPRFTWNGFRYFAVEGKAEVVRVQVVQSDVRRTSAFESSNEVLNWLHDTFQHTQLCNMHMGIPTDCPHLERKGYTGDGQLTCAAALLTLDYKQFLRKWINDISDCQDRKTGHVQYTAPYTRNGGGPGGWGSAIVSVPMDYYRCFGETDVLRENYEGMCAYIGFLVNHSKDGLVVSDREGEWCLGDWCAPGGIKIPEPFVNTYFLVKSLQNIREAEEALGLPDRFEKLRKEAAESICRHFFDNGTGDFASGVQGANAFALDIGLGDNPMVGATVACAVAVYGALNK